MYLLKGVSRRRGGGEGGGTYVDSFGGRTNAISCVAVGRVGGVGLAEKVSTEDALRCSESSAANSNGATTFFRSTAFIGS